MHMQVHEIFVVNGGGRICGHLWEITTDELTLRGVAQNLERACQVSWVGSFETHLLARRWVKKGELAGVQPGAPNL